MVVSQKKPIFAQKTEKWGINFIKTNKITLL